MPDNFNKLVKASNAYSKNRADIDRMSILREINYGNKIKQANARYESRQSGINTGLQFAQLLTGLSSGIKFNKEIIDYAKKEGFSVTSGNLKNTFGTPEFEYGGNKYTLDDISALKQYREMQDKLNALDVFKAKKDYTEDEYNIDMGY